MKQYETDENTLIEAIVHCLNTMNILTHSGYKIKIDYTKKRIVCTKGIIFKSIVTDKSFDEFISEFLEKKY